MNSRERSGLDLSLRGRAEGASGELNFFTYGISNFVFLDFTGEEVEGLREANYLQGDSRFVGAEGKGDVRLGRSIRLNGGFSVVRATLTDTDEHLPRIPPVSGRVAARPTVAWHHGQPGSGHGGGSGQRVPRRRHRRPATRCSMWA